MMICEVCGKEMQDKCYDEDAGRYYMECFNQNDDGHYCFNTQWVES